MTLAVGRWTHESVRGFAGESDPVKAILDHARSVVLDAMDQGWKGPPFDPIELADLLGIEVMAAEGVRDARILVTQSGRFRIEFNPFRSPGRIRYNVAHEIVHTFFPDCGETIRQRAARHEVEGDDWQLEALCNVGAAEILMPAGVFPSLTVRELTAPRLLGLREEFSVSTESLLIRLAELSEEPVAAFASSQLERGPHRGRYRLDYVVPSPSWPSSRGRGTLLPEETLLGVCSAIGYSNRGVESWEQWGTRVELEVIAIPPYPGRVYPRVVGLARPVEETEPAARWSLKVVQGDALDPHGDGPRIVAHIVNDKTPRWGGGFALAVRRRFPEVQKKFIRLVDEDARNLRLGSTVMIPEGPDLVFANMVAQRGYGPSGSRRVRYSHLRVCLEKVAEGAIRMAGSVHMPRIGAGQGGGEWAVVEDLVRMTLGAAGVPVTVYDLPGTVHVDEQTDLLLH